MGSYLVLIIAKSPNTGSSEYFQEKKAKLNINNVDAIPNGSSFILREFVVASNETYVWFLFVGSKEMFNLSYKSDKFCIKPNQRFFLIKSGTISRGRCEIQIENISFLIMLGFSWDARRTEI
jgi:hypothetical protein